MATIYRAEHVGSLLRPQELLQARHIASGNSGTQYAAEDGGDPITHFHLSAPTKPVLEAVSLQSTKKEFH